MEKIIMQVLLGPTYLRLMEEKLFIGWIKLGLCAKSTNRNMEAV
jgi:hypothetical protein